MMKRGLDPSFFANEDIAKLKPIERLFFQGFWLCADREGRLEDRPIRLKAKILPYDNVDPEEMLASIAAGGHILRYNANGVRAIQILSWDEYGCPYTHERPSVISPPKDSDFPDLTLPCPNLAPTLPQGIRLKIKNKRLKIKDQLVESEEFSRFWKVYPKKVAKLDAIKAWNQHNLDSKADVVISAVLSQKNLPSWKKDGGQFVPHPASWIRGGRWNDEVKDPDAYTEREAPDHD
jgi:hypothetical protein